MRLQDTGYADQGPHHLENLPHKTSKDDEFNVHKLANDRPKPVHWCSMPQACHLSHQCNPQSSIPTAVFTSCLSCRADIHQTSMLQMRGRQSCSGRASWQHLFIGHDLKRSKGLATCSIPRHIDNFWPDVQISRYNDQELNQSKTNVVRKHLET